MKTTIEKLNSLLYSATKKRPDGPPSVLSGAESEKENNERNKLKSFLAETLAKQLVQKGMKDVTEYELHQIVYAIATKTSLGKDFTHLGFQALQDLWSVLRKYCSPYKFGNTTSCVQPKPGFGIGNWNQGQIYISVSEPIFFSETKTFLFSKIFKNRPLG